MEKIDKHLNIIENKNYESDISDDSLQNKEYRDLLQKELSKVPFGALVSAKEELDVLSNMRNEYQKCHNNKKQLKEILLKNKEKVDKKKHSKKHAPLEVSSKKPVSRRRQVVPVTIIERRDPRFDFQDRVNPANLSSKYSFIKDYQQEEIKMLKNAMKFEKNQEEKQKLKKAITSLESKLTSAKNKEEALRVLREHKKIEKAKIEAGKTPFFLKKREQKKLIEMDKLSKLKGTKALDRYMKRKDKKLASKERKRLSRYHSRN
ncbi:unnamed protein product [Pneumocystis jirovecii]|uniref:rRNA biogenesis protein RRP36 n=2 Tax=Pneumocystis jirovecii TaxID=42068 RepID=L0PHI8_PNEJI|nr:uncharacterized protein T551_03261 [Pneumocystis jirovecii RU7]KTW26799.1 hypothetical protein T551_03261 [Pneumocystis jirovecii RU7]CCJ31534.1 unnamed protein product [Pneumocystis jirovecii]